MFKQIKHFLGYNLINLKGWKTKKKIIVIESDDWGTIRMPSKVVRNALLSNDISMFNSDTYDKVDNLANAEDLIELFKVLQKYTDLYGNHPKITANTIVANPDFEKIKASRFTEYYYEKFTTTLEGYPTHNNTLNIWKEGIKAGVFWPQLHGREHINVNLWLKTLRDGEDTVCKAFANKTWPARTLAGERLDVAYNYKDSEQLEFIIDSIKQSALIFEELFGYCSKSFIAPSYTWCTKIEKTLKDVGVNYIQGGLNQLYPQKIIDDINKRKQRHYTGQHNNLNQIYFMRNVHFEPALTDEFDIVSRCLRDIEIAFKWGKPAIISSHRLNYIGNIEKSNRDNTLQKLDQLLGALIKKYPDIEFMSSDQLGDLITH